MTLRILVPLDKLDLEHPALHFARLNFPDAHLFLSHVLPPLDVLPDLEDGAVERVRDVLHHLGEGEVFVAEYPAEVMLRLAQTGSFDLIVMGTQRKGRLEHLVLGSVAERVVRESPVPVITVPMTTPTSAGKVQRITVLHDFSAAADRAYRTVKTIWPAAEVQPVHIYSPGSVITPFELESTPGSTFAEQFAQQNLAWKKEAELRLEAMGGGRIVQGDAPQLAVEQATQQHVDLVAMGTASKPLMSEWLFGSVAQKVVRESPVPVLTVHAPSNAASRGVI